MDITKITANIKEIEQGKRRRNLNLVFVSLLNG